MDKIKKCPHCGCENIERTDLLTADESGIHEEYFCLNESCYKYFYVYKYLEVYQIDVGKEKYDDYEVVYKKYE